ncbi:MAG: protein-L-isoaspartate(D-aspartate) O-methyltransferase [Candidatus Neomarinimicrobiota bacterium]
MKLLSICSIISLTLPLPAAAQDGPPDFTTMRQQMVRRQISGRGVEDRAVLQAMAAVPRHLFVPAAERRHAYDDTPLQIGYDQTISQPYIVAFMTELLDVGPGDKVLEIGTGSGYQAAVLARLARQVYSIEIVPELGRSAAARLDSLGYKNVSVKIGDGYRGWPDAAPFDRIIVTAAPEEIPPRLIEQLKPSGKMVLPCGSQWWVQDLLVVDKDQHGRITTSVVTSVRFVPMIHGRD